MAKFNFSNFKESLNGLTKRAKNIKVKRSDSSRYSKGKRSAASDQSLAGVLQNTDLLDCSLSL